MERECRTPIQLKSAMTGGRQNPALNLGDRGGLHRSLLLYLTRTKGFRKRSRVHSIHAIEGQNT